MKTLKGAERLWVIFFIFWSGFCVLAAFVGEVLYVNRTPSMPIGIYKKNFNKNLSIGDIIVFKTKDIKKGNLIKYIGAVGGDEYCYDHEEVLWVNNFPIAKKNILKYIGEAPQESMCQTLKEGEILAIGEHPDSFDSRYFGPISIDDIEAKVTLLIKM